MSLFFFCRGSAREGLGHLTRTRNVVRELAPQTTVRVGAVGDRIAERILADCGCEHRTFQEDGAAFHWGLSGGAEVVVFDALTLSVSCFEQARRSSKLISLSPVFEHLSHVDIVYHRSAIQDPAWSAFRGTPRLKCGLRYAVIGEHSRRIPSALYRKSLFSDPLSIAVSMGGADASNRTLQVVRKLGDYDRKLRVWVILGEGYSHSYQDLVDSISGSRHEIILAKTNDSMWRILSDCALILLAGGVSTYEAAYAGLPSINLLEDQKRYFLIQELVEANACLYVGAPSSQSFSAVTSLLDRAYEDRQWLYRMHRQAKGMIDGRGAKRIASEILRWTSR